VTRTPARRSVRSFSTAGSHRIAQAPAGSGVAAAWRAASSAQ
jgi:hypothetical protein